MSEPAEHSVTLGPRSVRTVTLNRTQQLIWTSQRLDRDVPLANMGKRWRLRGAVDPARLAAAVDVVVRTCEVLRMAVDAGGEVARILAEPPRATEVVDLPAAELDAWSRHRIAQPVDATNCVYDSVLLRHADDDWTYEQFGSVAPADVDLAGVVDGHFFDTSPPAPPARDTPEDRAAAWAADVGSAGPQPPIEPYGARGPRTSAVSRVPIPLPDSQWAGLDAALDSEYRTISRELGLLTVAAMATAITVHRLDGRRSVVMGVPVHHRSSKVTRRLVGPLMELYPLTVTVDPDEPFRDMFARVLGSVTVLLRRARPGESPPAPFEIVLNVLTARYGDFAGFPTQTEWMRSGHVEPGHALRVQVYDYAGDGAASSQRWELDVNRSLSADDAAARLPEHLGRVLDAVASDPDATAADVTLVGAGELVELADLSPDPEPRPAGRPVHDQVRDALRADPEWVVAEHGDRTIAAAEFDERAEALAAWLVERGLRRGDAVGLRMPRGIDVLVALHGVLRAGGVFVMLAPDDPPARHELIAADADLFLILDELPAVDAPHGAQLPQIGPDDRAYILYTSGSTGTPKGVPISHRGLADYLGFAVDAYVDGPPPVVALHSALVFDLTVTSLLLSFLAGGRVVVFDEEPVAALGAIAADDRITFLKATPSQLELFVRLANTPRPLRSIVVGGEAFRRPVAERSRQVCRPGVRIFNEYGPTEAVVGCMVHEWDPEIDTGIDVPIGHACPGSELRVLDAYGQPTPTGSWGELYVRRPGMATAYLHRPELSTERFVASAGDDRPDLGPWYRTGDRVRVERRGVATYGGRMDDQLKVNGIRLEPAEVEAALVALDGIESALVRVWHPTDRVGTLTDEQRCARCGLGVDVPGVELDAERICNACRTFDAVAPQTDRWFRTEDDLAHRLADARTRSTGPYDCLHLLSGGKDSTYALYQLVERGWRVHALTLDNGFISDGAKENIRRSVADLGITHEFATTEVMNEIFRDSLDRYSNVCQGCYKTIYTIAVARARELGIPAIVTGLSRGQFFETRLVPHQFESGRFDPDEIDATVLEARRVYHRTPDAVTELLPEQRVFDDLAVLDEIEFVDFYRYVDVELAEMYRFLEDRAPWVRPADTGRSTNCLINVAGIRVHRQERGFHNYAEPYSWDVRLGHKTRDEALEELDDEIDDGEVARLLATIGYQPKTNGVLTAWYRTDDGSDRDPAELRHQLRRWLPEHAVPSAFVRVDEMPLAASAKADPSSLPPPLRFHRHGTGAVPPSTPVESRLCEIWCDVLGLDQIGVTDDFFDLGGASLDALEVVAAIDAEYGTDLNDAAVFRARTVRDLAAALQVARGAATGSRRSDPIAPVEAPLPLSAGEEAMLFDYRMDPADTRYNVTRCYRVTTDTAGAFDPERFAASVRAVAAVHEPLSIAFDAARTPLGADAVSVEQLAPMSADEFDAFADAQRAVPFDLDDGPLIRVHMAATGPTETTILIGMHHISVDAGTFDVLWDQLADHYEHGRLPDVPVGYAAHGAWQRRQVESSRAHWLRQSRRRRPSGPLGFRTPTPAEPDGYLSLRLDVSPADLAPRGSTGFAAAMAATATTLARATARSSVEFGITASTKDHVDVAPVVGYHLNTIPMAMDVRHGDRFADVVRAASEAISSSIDHRAYPFASIVRDARASGFVEPDVSCMLAYEQLAPARFPGGTAEHRILASGTSVSDVTFFVQERASAVQLGLEYRGSVLSRDDARRLLDVFAGVLVDGARNNTATIAELVDGTAEGDLVGAALPRPERSVLDRLVARAVDTPDAVAVVDAAGRRRSYGELVVAASALAARVEDLADGRPRRVGVAVRRSVDLVTAMLAAQLSGASYVPLDPSAPVERLRLAVESAALDVLVVDGLDAATVGVAPDRIVELAGVDLTAGAHGDAADRAARVELDDPAYLIFTSGSTGTPRGVEVSHRNLASSNDARILHYGVSPARFLVTSSIGFDSSIVGLVWPLTTGGTVVVPGDDDVHDVDRLGALVEGLAVSHVLMVPSLYRALLERAGRCLAGLDTAVVAGEACPPGLVRRHHELVPGVELVNEYGPTEATVWSTVHALRVDDASASSVPIGLPIPGTTLRVVDDQLAPVLSGVAGELLISSPGVVAGYLHRERPDVFVELDGRRWYRTGDLVRLVAGVVEFLGRVDDQLNVGGVRLEPGEVEAELLRIEGIRDAVVVAAGDPAVLVAHVVGDVVDEPSLRSTLSRRLPPPAVPRWFVQHDELPRTSHGKVDRSAAARLPLPVVAPVSTERSPDDPVVELVVATWRDVLGRDDVTAHTDFFALGGDSLSAVAIVTALGDDLGEMVPIATLLAGRTPNGMAERLAPSVAAPAAGADEAFGIVTFREGAPGGPLVVLAPSWFDVFGYQDLAFAFADDVRVDALVYVQQPGTPPVTTVADMTDGFEPLAAAMVDGRTDVAIIGWSVGGVVAAELANRLTAEGRTVRFVGMVDTYFPGEVRHVWSNRWWKYRSMLRPGATSEIVAEIGVTIRRRARRIAGRVGRRLVAWSGSPLPPEAVRTPVGTKVPPEAQYHPLASIDVPLVLYRASTTNPARTIEKWRTLAPSLDDIVIEGRHRGFDSIMEAGKVDRIADDVDRRLRPPTP